MGGSSTEHVRAEDIAVVGVSGRFPGAKNVAEFWRNLRDGVESISFFTDEELRAAGLDEATLRDPNYVRAAGALEGIELFAAPFFGVNPREAEVLDPQHRLFLECAWEALEDAGYNTETYAGRVGVYAGAGMNTYLLYNLYTNREVVRSVGDFQAMIGNDKDFLPTRVSYKLNLRGPSVSVQTACSTSLVAVCLACQSLQSYQCDMVLAGGVSVRVPARAGYFYQEGGILSPDGHCRAFDAEARGTVVGSGVGIVVLKRLEDALADGDTVHAVIKGSALNNDGSMKVGYTAPSVEGQAEVIGEALGMAGVEAETISYVEAHGTGTTLGDPIEIAALAQVFRAATEKRNFCAVGSVKTNVGHLDTAAGVAGLIKTVLALKHGQLPPSLHFEEANASIDFAGSPFFVNNRLTPWGRGSHPRRAGVSSFGIGGTNAHVVVEEAPEAEPTDEGRPWQLLLLSARTATALEAATANLAAHLKRHPEARLADVAYTCAVGRRAFEHRRAVVCRDREDAVHLLEGGAAGRVFTGSHLTTSERPVAFMFSGLGAQHVGMGGEIYRLEPVFREHVDACSETLRPHLGFDLREVLYPTERQREGAERKLAEISVIQPAVFVTAYALAGLWMSWGVRPASMIGHSTGEYVAACLAGVFTLEDALALVASRARLMQGMAPGGMLAVPLPEAELRARLNGELSVAAVNAPSSCVVAGRVEALGRLEEELTREGLDCRRVKATHAFHSRMMEPALAPFAERVGRVRLSAPQIPFVSNLTGTWITPAQATDPDYWAQHLSGTVRFADGVGELLKEPESILLEVGPGRMLSSLVRQHPSKSAAHVVLSTLPHPSEQVPEQSHLLGALGKLWLAGKGVDARGFYRDERRRRVPLPTYPFERQRYWVEARRMFEAAAPDGARAREQDDARRTPTELQTPPPALHTRPGLSSRYVAPRGEVEHTLARIWEGLLGVSPVGVGDDFFELNGHSLLATQVISRVREQFRVELPLRSLFESPTVAGLAARVEEARLAAESAPAAHPMLPVPRDGELPLSFAQQRLWFLDQLVPGNPFYNVPVAVRLVGQLDASALERSLDEILARHEVLRTTFPDAAGRAVQRIAPAETITLDVLSLCDLAGPEREREALRLAGEEARRPFDLVAGPMMRATLLALDEAEHVLLLTMHHIASDGWSLGVLVGEVAALYASFKAGLPPSLPPLPIQYADFAYWQREWFRGAVLDEQLAYWKQRLGGELPVLELPADRPRPAVQTFRGASKFFHIEPGLVDALKQLSQRESVTLFMTLLAAFKALLHRYTGETDIIVGSGIANRNRVEIEGLIGFFVNTMVLRTDTGGDPRFTDLLMRVRETALGAYAHQDLPFEQLVEELQPRRDMSHAPFFQVVFVLQNAPMPALEAAGLEVRLLEVASETAKYDMTFSLEETGGGLKGNLEYNTDLFDADRIDRFVGHYRALLESAAGTPSARISELALLTEGERRQLLVGWNETAADFPREACVHELFERQAAATPAAPALKFVGADGVTTELSYRELDARANRLARHLSRRGAGPEQVVGLCVERSAEMLVGVLGVLKAGAAYLPLDPSLPRERLSLMLEDAGARLVLTQGSLSEKVQTSGSDVVLLVEDWEATAREPHRDAPRGALPDNLAYVIYTSGSTGRPKGVAVTHRGLCNLVAAQTRAFGVGAESRVLQFASLGFDASASEIFMALATGATLFLTDRDTLVSIDALTKFLREHDITTLTLTPTVLALLDPTAVPRLRTIISAGEACSAEVAARWSRGRRFFNAYGPTEASVCASFAEYKDERDNARHDAGVDEHDDERVAEHDDERDAGRDVLGPPIGRPLSNVRVHVLDQHLRPVPVGIPGEIYVGGVGVARGYYNRPGLTAAAFVPNPFGGVAHAEAGERLYKTGDAARLMPDGQIQFLGRLDQQVKLRGFRIELGEVEAVINSHPAVSESVVVAREDMPGDARLVAYVLPRASGASSAETLTDNLAAEHTSGWQALYEDVHREAALADGSTFNITGWTSSYTGRPIPAEEMREWVEQTVARVLSLRPARVWEIGCGTGLLLFRIAPHCAAYRATDFSPEALAYVRRQMSALEEPLPQVTLARAAADDFEGVEPHTFDAVVLNSVVQYFPDTEYLLRVLGGAAQAVRPGGSIFVGDVRSFPLLRAFHASVETHRAPSSLDTAQLRSRVAEQVEQEEELTIDPSFFHALRRRLPEITGVDIQLKRGRHDNELTRFRYDVVLSVGGHRAEASELRWLDWRRERLSLDGVRRLLADGGHELVGVRHVPNARVLEAVKTAALLESFEGAETAGALREAVRETLPAGGVDPEEFHALGRDLSYTAAACWSAGADDCFDVVFKKDVIEESDDDEQSRVTYVVAAEEAAEADGTKPPGAYANDPLRGKLARDFRRRLTPALRESLQEKLPEYMVPSAFVFLDALPLTPSGKVDRRRLPAPGETRPPSRAALAAPRNRDEEVLAGIFSEVLRLERVGIDDDFFECGGHSLLATQVVSRVRENFGVELPVRSLFETPTVAALAEKVAEVRGAGGCASDTLPPAPVAREGAMPLSFAQQRLWFLDQFEPDSPAYNIPAAVRLKGLLDTSALERAFDEVVGRHESLRTRFISVDGVALQEVVPELEMKLTRVDLSRLPGDVRETEVARLALEDARRPFRLSDVPLIRAGLLLLSPDEHVLLLAMHHIISDGWSMAVLIGEIAALYEAFAAGRPSPLAELPIQYADFAAWQRRWLRGAVLDEQLAYWKQQLADAPAVLELPADRPRPAVQTYDGAAHFFALPESLSASLQAESRRAGVTLFMTLLAAFQTLLHRYTGREDISVGSPVAGRNRAETEPLIGFLVNTLVLRTNLGGDPTFSELLERVREVTLAAYTHQDVPFERLVEELQPARHTSHTPLFQVMFVWQNAPMPRLELPGLELTAMPIGNGTAKFDLTLSLAEQGGGLTGSLEYNTALFDAATVRRMSEHFQVLLEAIAADPSRRLSALPVLTEEERRRTLFEWNRTRRAYADERLIHELFEARAEAEPDAIAVVFEDEELTCAELNLRANRLAHHLRGLGVGPDVAVGVMAERSVEMVVALLGTLKAGGAYVPLDPAYPRERLAFMLEDARVKVVLTQERLLEQVPRHAGRVICLDSCDEAIARAETSNPSVNVSADNLAYVIYTSGTTGRPKGAMNTHAGVVNRLLWMQEAYALTPADRVLQKTPFGFDVSVWEFFWPLITGARLVVARPGGHRDGAYLCELIVGERITTLHFVPSMLQSFLDEPRLADVDCLRRVVCSGEALSYGLQQRFHARLGAELHNLYGPTEAAIDVTCWPCERGGERTNVPIGRPVANTRIYITDAELRPVPVGVAGELHIGGVQLARGYLLRPGLTAASFIPDPFSSAPGARLYKTGDRARYHAGGEIEFLGRLDHQVKLRGFRVELGEIEATLAQCPTVREAVVVAREDAGGGKRLVAYVVAGEGTTPAAEELRAFVKTRLPEYMMPSAFVFLDALPLTAHGKIDRRRLPAPAASRPSTGPRFVAPRTATEEVVANIWSDVLKLESVGVDDNYFESGGHSLLATQAVSRARAAFGVDVPLRTLFEAPTVAAFSSALAAASRGGAADTLPPLTARASDGPRPPSFAQQRLWFLDQLEPDSPAYNIPVALRLEGLLKVETLGRSLDEVVRRHESLRTTFTVGPDRQPVQVVAHELKLPLKVEDLSALPESEREREATRLAALEARRPFDLARGPLVRARLLRLSAQEHVLLFTMHHIISDGWSLGVLVREAAALYVAFAVGEASPLPPPEIQYGDFAAWQREWLQGEALESQLDYWRARLGEDDAALELPADHPRPPARSYRGGRHSFVLNAETSARLRELGRTQGATLFMTLLAAWQALLARYSGREVVSVGTPVAGRNNVETESLIGFLVNTLVLRTDLAGDPAFTDLLKRVREVCLGAYNHQEMPFERLVGELQTGRDASHTPLFQVMFVLQNAPMPPLELPGLKLTPVEVDNGVAKFDLTLSAEESRQGLNCSLTYSTDLFEAATIARMAAHFLTLLEGAAADPSRRLSELPLLTEGERRRLLSEWNDTRTDYPRDVCFHQLFERQAAGTPDSIAVVCEDESLTYAELNARANRLARHLRSLGVGPEVLVGIFLERSAETVVAVLGVLKAGGAYVPLDPAYPRERLSFMLEDARIRVLLTMESLQENLPAGGARVVRLDTDRAAFEHQDEADLDARVDGANLAYIIYTSGSTGKSKGVLVEQRRLLNYAFSVLDRLELAPAASHAWVQPLTVDSCVTAIYPPLLTGGSLHVISRERAASAAEMCDYFTRHEIDCLKIAPSHLAALRAAAERPDELLPRSRLVLGGEVSHWAFVRELQSAAGCRVFNHYGPTETTVGVTTYHLGDDRAEEFAATVPIGRPLPNARVYVLDRHARPVPAGVAGELYIGGECLARGYLGRPELTAASFVPDAFSAEPGARLYRTGDLVRFLRDGSVEFLGRLDHQVKIRGFRVELGEVEAALSSHEGVREALVTAHEEAGHKSLVAYVVAEAGSALGVGELRGFVGEKLPDYMMPSAFVFLDALPLTAHGKIDRRRLPAPAASRHEAESSFVAPRSGVERRLAEIWAEVLGVERVGVEDNFFMLGGDSILSIQIIARANHAGLRLTPKQLFEHQTIAELAPLVGTGGPAAAVEAEQGAVTDPVPLTPIQRLFFEQAHPAPHHYNQSVLLEVRQPLEPSLLAKTIARLLAHHDALNLRFVREPEGWRQFNAKHDGAAPFEFVDLSALAESRQRAAIEAAAARIQASLDLSAGPLMRVALFRLGVGRPDRLLAAVHHLAVDGVSWRVLLEDMLTAYGQLSRGGEVSLPPKTTSFKRWAERLAEHAQSAEVRGEIDYWLAQAEKTRAALPSDYGGGENTYASARTVTASLDEYETRALLYAVPEVYNTQSNDVLLTALALGCARWSGHGSLAVALEGHGREDISDDIDLSRTVGWFTTLFPVALDLGATRSPGEALKSVKEQLRRVPRRGIGYGLLRHLNAAEELRGRVERLRAAGLPPLSFNYLGQFDQVLPASSPFRLAREATGPLADRHASRRHVLDVAASVIENRLQLVWTYSENLHRRATVEALADNFMNELRALIAHCRSPAAGGHTPSDFPLAGLEQGQLDGILTELGEDEFEAIDE